MHFPPLSLRPSCRFALFYHESIPEDRLNQLRGMWQNSKLMVRILSSNLIDFSKLPIEAHIFLTFEFFQMHLEALSQSEGRIGQGITFCILVPKQHLMEYRQILSELPTGSLRRFSSFLTVPGDYDFTEPFVRQIIPNPPELSLREMQVLQGMARGQANREIGEKLDLVEDTIKTHARRLFRKLGVNSREQAVTMGFRYGLLE